MSIILMNAIYNGQAKLKDRDEQSWFMGLLKEQEQQKEQEKEIYKDYTIECDFKDQTRLEQNRIEY